MGFEVQDVERKTLAILEILKGSEDPLGARVITRHLKDYGVKLGERAVRYHLKMMDGRGLTRLLGPREGRVLTEPGIEEVESALVEDKVGFAMSKIEVLAFRTTFDAQKLTGQIPINVSFFPRERFSRALNAMKPAFEAGLPTGTQVPQLWANHPCRGRFPGLVGSEGGPDGQETQLIITQVTKPKQGPGQGKKKA